MSGGVQAHSFDRPRERPAPVSFTGSSLDGEAITHSFDRLSLIVAIKSSCDGCRDFVSSALHELADVALFVVSATPDEAGEWTHARHPIVVAPHLFGALDIRSAPFYVLIDPTRERVVSEGVVFGPSQVAAEIAPYLSS